MALENFNELSEILRLGGVVSDRSKVFWTTNAQMPTSAPTTSPKAIIQLVRGGGGSDEFVQNSFDADFVTPTFQVNVRGWIAGDVETMALLAHKVFGRVRNQTVLGTFYREIRCLQPPVDSGKDDATRILYRFNIRAIKRPS
jgi:hypothetical protein